jgi:hypothetical protein
MRRRGEVTEVEGRMAGEMAEAREENKRQKNRRREGETAEEERKRQRKRTFLTLNMPPGAMRRFASAMAVQSDSSSSPAGF